MGRLKSVGSGLDADRTAGEVRGTRLSGTPEKVRALLPSDGSEGMPNRVAKLRGKIREVVGLVDPAGAADAGVSVQDSGYQE